jgi:hypothetical protein
MRGDADQYLVSNLQHEVFDLSVAELRELLGDRRTKYRLSGVPVTQGICRVPVSAEQNQISWKSHSFSTQHSSSFML